MKRVPKSTVLGTVATCVAARVPAAAGTLKCPPDSVKVGNVCIDAPLEDGFEQRSFC